MTVREQVLDDIRHGSLQTAADLQGVTVDELREYLGMEPLPKKQRNEQYARIPKEIMDECLDQLRAGMNVGDVAKQHGLLYSTVDLWRRSEGIPKKYAQKKCDPAVRGIVREMLAAGASIREIAAGIGVSNATALRWKNELGGNDETI